ncbi:MULTISPECIES: FAD-binding domain [Hyphomonas]|jgi:2-polyprenyl-6-methoxyphenol hydroxylase-like FAD-dependent oxidoreductase|uniref:FAD-binding domain n=1 Tax=Hyphomonas TaxID=85 RepID=UPI0005503713|nr:MULTISPECIES: FAD-binding domain [Hyphomonas]MAK56907.1 hypothetical protein [Pusillimonas sp.]MAN89331.1 hypothetical protein [Hyphomonadaceae bacterium]HAQ76236.1 hypothetical protein [Hyphomonas sp.]|tara:strand:- start:6485 stop:7672 length:1188 start_codon:yes stop_codon:yes gene_type:complete
MKICISGAGVAGPTLAYWLLKDGHEVTIIEEAPKLRTGGYVIDFWGVGYDVAEKMGIRETIHDVGYDVESIRMVNDGGRTRGGFSTDVFRRMTRNRYTSLARGDLARIVFETVADRVDTRFGQTITAIEQTDEAVSAEFSNGQSQTFDMLVGADGLHSNVRRLVWGAGPYERKLGYYVAAFECDNYPHRDENVYLNYAEPGRSVSRYALRGNRSLILFVFSADQLPGGKEPESNTSRISVLHEIYAESEWEVPQILKRLDAAGDIYFDRVSQIEVPSWSKGRVALVGDAAACASLLAGEGTGLAMTESYVLAGELHSNGGDVLEAGKAYEARLREFLEEKQQSARDFASSFTPKTEFGIWLRNLATHFMIVPPIADLLMGNTVKDDFELPDYGFE